VESACRDLALLEDEEERNLRTRALGQSPSSQAEELEARMREARWRAVTLERVFTLASGATLTAHEWHEGSPWAVAAAVLTVIAAGVGVPQAWSRERGDLLHQPLAYAVKARRAAKRLVRGRRWR
jgi:hypothetical protein